MPIITNQELIDFFGAREFVDALQDRTPVRVSAKDLERQIAADPSDPATDPLNAALLVALMTGFREEAESEVYSRIGGIHYINVPITDPSPTLKRRTADLARYYMYKAPTQSVLRRYDDAVEWLTLVADNQANVGLDSNNERLPTSNKHKARVADTSTATSTDPDGRVFTKKSLRNFTEGYN